MMYASIMKPDTKGIGLTGNKHYKKKAYYGNR
jgi:hypothetical protein